MQSPHSTILQALSLRIAEIETHSHPRCQPPISLGIAPLDALFLEGRLPPGSLVELLSAIEGAGTWTLALVMAKHVCGDGKVLVVVDGQRCFYPPAAAHWGINLDESIVIHPRSRRDALLATNQSLRCAAVGAVLGNYEQLSTLEARRLQMAAEAGGSIGLVLRPQEALRAPSFANLRLLISPVASADVARCLRIDVVRCRPGKSGLSVLLEVSDETGLVRVLPEVASAAAPTRATRASG